MMRPRPLKVRRVILHSQPIQEKRGAERGLLISKSLRLKRSHSTPMAQSAWTLRRKRSSQMYDRDTIPMRKNVWNEKGELAHDWKFFHIYLLVRRRW